MHNDNRPIIHPYAGIALGLLAVSAASIIVKLIQNEHVPSLVISAYRLTLASLALAPLALTRHRDEPLKLDPPRSHPHRYRRNFPRAALRHLDRIDPLHLDRQFDSFRQHLTNLRRHIVVDLCCAKN